jgi:hypothetical protein
VAYRVISLISNALKDLSRWAVGRSNKLSPEEAARLRQQWKEEIESHLRRGDGRVGGGEAIIRDVKRIHSYPYPGGKRKAISPWFKVDLLGTYDCGLQVGLKLVGLKYEPGEKAWRFCNYGGGESADLNAYLVGLIPFERIVSINWEGDEYDHTPHIYCSFTSKNKEPYEEIIICERRHLDHQEYYAEIATYEQVRKLSKKKGYHTY